MASTQGIVSQNVGRVPGMQHMLGTEETPETGAFDFLNYLLGLQVDSAGKGEGDETMASALMPKTDSTPSEDPLLKIFQKKEEPMWNPMFPMVGQSQIHQVLPNQQVEAKSVEDLGMQQQPEQTIQGENRYSSKTEDMLSSPANFLNLQGLRNKNGSDAFGTALDSGSQIGDKNSTANKIQKFAFHEPNGNQVESSQAYSALTRVQNQTVRGNEIVQQAVQHNPLPVDSEVSESHGKDRKKQQEESLFALGNLNPATKLLSQDKVPAEINGKDSKAHSLPEVFKKVESMVHNGGGKMTVQLTPPDLGRVEIQVIAKGKNVEIKMKSENEFAKVALESHMSDLRDSMQGQDLQLNKVEVMTTKDWDKSQLGGMFSSFSGNQQQQSQFHGFSRENPRDSGSRNFDFNIHSRASAASAGPVSTGSHRSATASGRVDIRI